MDLRDRQAMYNGFGDALARAFELVLTPAVFGFFGWLLDRWLETAPWMMVGGIVLGSAVGFYEFIRIISKIK